MKYVLAIAAAAVLFSIYVRLAPSDPARWHVDPAAAEDPGVAGTKIKAAGQLVAFDAIVTAAPRVARLAGSVEAGHATYVARSLVFGFPDYISVKQVGAELVILSRLRFGRSDLGVNRRRLRAWLERL